MRHRRFVALLQAVALLGLTCGTRVTLGDGREVLEGDRVDRELAVEFCVGLKHRASLEDIEAELVAVSDPASPRYGHYLSIEDLSARFGPDSSAQAVVQEHFTRSGSASLQWTRGRDFAVVTCSAAAAEALLDVELRWYRGTAQSGIDTGPWVRAATAPRLPPHVRAVVDIVSGMELRFPLQRRNVARAVSPRPRAGSGGAGVRAVGGDPFASCNRTGCTGTVTPEVLIQRYNVTSPQSRSQRNTQCVVQFLGESYDPRDLSLFEAGCGIPVQSPVEIRNNNASNPRYEASLDIEYLMGVSRGAPTTFWGVNGSYGMYEPFLKWVVELSNTSDVPLVHSASYGEPEAALSSDYMTRVSLELGKLGLRGLSMLFASGDDGVGGDFARFSPLFPASSPFATAVGGTEFGGTWVGPGTLEVGAPMSGGGFSALFPRPSYQASAVATYLRSQAGSLPTRSAWNASGRGFPDIAAHCGQNNPYTIEVVGVCLFAAGTSCSTPTVAGIVSLVNDALLERGHPPVGFLNTALYGSLGGTPALFDVTNGTNPCHLCDGSGFSAAQGWDPVTGLGTPSYADLVSAFLAFHEKK